MDRLEAVARGQARCGSGSLPQQGTPVHGTRRLGEGYWLTSHSQYACLGGKCLSPVLLWLSLKPLVVTGALDV